MYIRKQESNKSHEIAGQAAAKKNSFKLTSSVRFDKKKHKDITNPEWHTRSGWHFRKGCNDAGYAAEREKECESEC